MIYSTAESLCGEFFAKFCDLPNSYVNEFMGNRIRFELATENAADLTSSDFERFNEEFKKRFTTGGRYGRSSDKQVLTRVQKSYCRDAVYACLTFIQYVRWVRVDSPKVFDEQKFLQDYPWFYVQCFDQKELSSLLLFRNYAAAFLSLLPARKRIKSQGRILHIAGLLSTNVKYITGAGQTAETSRRVQIYEHEGGDRVEKEKSKKFTNNSPSVCASNDTVKVYTQLHRQKKTKGPSTTVTSVSKKGASSAVASKKRASSPVASKKRASTAVSSKKRASSPVASKNGASSAAVASKKGASSAAVASKKRASTAAVSPPRPAVASFRLASGIADDDFSVSSKLSELSTRSVTKRRRLSSVLAVNVASDGSTTCASGASEDSILFDARPTASVVVPIVALDAGSWVRNANRSNLAHFGQDRGVLQSSEDPEFQDVLQDLCHLY